MPKGNLFWGDPSRTSQMQTGPVLSPDILGGYKTIAPGSVPRIDWSNGRQKAAALGTTAGLVNGFSLKILEK